MPEAPKNRNLPDDPAHGLRTPPQSIQSEQAVLGGLLIDNTALDRSTSTSSRSFSTASPPTS